MSSSFNNKRPQNIPTKNYTVQDESDMDEVMMQESVNPYYKPEVEAEPQQPATRELTSVEREKLAKTRREIAKMGVKVSDYARKRIEILANIGRETKTVDLDGIIFDIQTLKTREAREAMMSAFAAQNDADAGYEIRRHTLARAIYRIDGQPIEMAVGGDSLELKLSVIDEMEEAITSRLYREYVSLKNEIDNKYAPQTKADLEGVIEDVKK